MKIFKRVEKKNTKMSFGQIVNSFSKLFSKNVAQISTNLSLRCAFGSFVTKNNTLPMSGKECPNSLSLNVCDVQSLIFTQQRSYKVKTRLRKRCKSCYFIWRNGRLYVECPEHPRHKQHHIDSFLKGYDNIPNGYVVSSKKWK